MRKRAIQAALAAVLLHAALLKSHGDYTVRLRGAIKDAQRMIPWLSGAGIGDPAQALVAWLKG